MEGNSAFVVPLFLVQWTNGNLWYLSPALNLLEEKISLGIFNIQYIIQATYFCHDWVLLVWGLCFVWWLFLIGSVDT